MQETESSLIEALSFMKISFLDIDLLFLERVETSKMKRILNERRKRSCSILALNRLPLLFDSLSTNPPLLIYEKKIL